MLENNLRSAGKSNIFWAVASVLSVGSALAGEVGTFSDAKIVNAPTAATSSIDEAIIQTDQAETSFWKPTFHIGATLGADFTDNLFITSDDQVSDTILFASARATFAYGNVQSWAARFIDTTSRALLADQERGGENLIAVTYSPTAQYFIDNDDLNTVDHDLAATIRWAFTKLRVALDGRFQTLSDPEPDLGRRADRDILTAHLQLSYDWTEKTRLETNFDLQSRNYESGQDSTQFSGDLFVLYRGMAKTTWGFGLAAGQLDLDGGDTQDFQQALLRISYDSFSKITATATIGGELRQTADGDQTNGVFQIGVNYDATETTRLYLSAVRRTDPSANGDSQSIERTSLSLGWDQKLFQKLYWSNNLNYTLAEYSEPEGGQSRTDHLLSLSTALTFEVTQYGFVRLAYIFSQNDSDSDFNSYEANQARISVTALF